MTKAKIDCLMTDLDADVIQFELSDDILISATLKNKGCASTLNTTTLLKSQISMMLRRMEAYLKSPIESCQIKIVGTVDAIASYEENSNERLKRATLVAKPGAALTALVYPASGRIRTALAADAPVTAPSVVTPASVHVIASPVAKRRTRVLIVDDSITIRRLLTKVLAQDPDLEVVGTIEHPDKVVAAIESLKPDVLTLDIHMPGMDGVTLLKKLMPMTPLPVVMITSVSKAEGPMVFEALEAGAIDYIQKPSMAELAMLAPIIIEKVKSAAMAKVRVRAQGGATLARLRASRFRAGSWSNLIAIGASTGGTEALKDLFLRLPESIPPILVVQHIPPVFSQAFASRLNDLCPFEVKEAADGDEIKPDRVLIAPGGKQMRLRKSGADLVVEIFDGEHVNRHKPSVDVLFDSVVDLVGARALGVILTGMGADGAKGLVKMRKAGSHTIAQNEASCVVFGMPREAILQGGAERVAHLFEIPEILMRWLEEMRAA